MLSHTEKGGWKFHFQQECALAFQSVFVFSSLILQFILQLSRDQSHGETKRVADPIVIIASQVVGALVERGSDIFFGVHLTS